MQTLSEFIVEWNNKPADYDGYYGYQCFDIVQYWRKNLGIPNVLAFPYAYQLYTLYGSSQSQYFDRIYNGPVALPKAGDIVVWSWYYNYAGGHTGIATGKGVSTGSNADWFECFEQNDPTGSYCHLRNYNYDQVLGWLRPKILPPLVLTDGDLIKKIKGIINTPITDTDFRNKTRVILGV